MSICSSTPDVTSISKRDEAYVGSILPAMGTSRDSTGRLNDQQLETIYQSLVTNGKLVSNQKYQESLNRISNGIRADTKVVLETIGVTEKATMAAIQDEFCFNYKRYKFSLQNLFDTIVSTSQGTTLTDDQKTEIQSKLNKAKDFNTKLNDIIQITNFIAKKRATEMEGQNTQINNLNTSISALFKGLHDQNQMLKSQDALVQIRKRMVEYTMEKNNSASNLLALYGFLNIVAIGLLIHSYRA
jgi:hypothetical protein